MATKATFVNKARKDYPEQGIKKGESYWNWKFNFSKIVHRSKTKPRPQQLTNNAWEIAILDFQDQLEVFTGWAYEDIDLDTLREFQSEIESLRDEQQEKKDNMPESLQESSSAEILQERYDILEGVYDELDNIIDSLDSGIDEVNDLESQLADNSEDTDLQKELEDKKQEVCELLGGLSELSF